MNDDQCTNNHPAVSPVGLTGVPETALWVLHNRASTASDPTKEWFQDDKVIDIYKSLVGDFDFEGTYGKPDVSTAIRGWICDQNILNFWREHPDGTVVNFAEGLETQRFRLEKLKPEGSLWITVDLPETIEVRERFIQPDASKKYLHVTESALEVERWAKYLPKDKPIFFSAQGLFMYLEEDDVRTLFQTMAEKFPNSIIVFDVVSKWLSNKSMSKKGWMLTEKYRVPNLPFGVSKSAVVGLLRSWLPDAKVIEEIPWPLEKNGGFFNVWIVPILMRIPILKNLQPGMMMRVQFSHSSV